MTIQTSTRLGLGTIASAIAVFAAIGSGQAQPFKGTKYYVGSLNCHVSGSTGYIFGSSKELDCMLVRPSGATEAYEGSIKKYGIDIGYTKAAYVEWHAYSLKDNVPVGAMGGDFLGTQGSISAGAAAGSDGLIGGSEKSIMLQSVVLQGDDAGLNFAQGIAAISLKAK